MGLRVSVLFLGLCLVSCNSGGGGGGGGGFQIISSSVEEGAVWEINRPIEFLFSERVQLDSANLTTISIRPLAPLVAGAGAATTPSPVIGAFSLKSLATTDPNYNKIVVFQPACPPVTTSTGAANINNTGGAFEPGTPTVTYPYRIEVFSSNQTVGPVVTSASGKKLFLGLTRNFTTEQASSPYVDTLPTPLAAATSITNFPNGGAIELNTLTDPIVFTVVLDQAVLPGSFTGSAVAGSFQLLYNGGLGCNAGCPTSASTGCDPIPATYTLSNCDLTGATTVTVVPLGTLPPNTSISLVMDKDLEDVGGQKNFDDVVLATATVANKASTQLDMILEEFADTTNFDSDATDSFFPPAVWQDGYLQAAEPLPGLSVEPGVDITISSVVNVDTTQTVLTGISTTDSSTVNVNVVDGVIKVHNLTVTSTGQLIATGPNPLTILASGTVDLDTGGLISVRGGDSPTANVSSFSLTGASVSDPGGVGQCGGGDGGAASPETAASDAKGGDGNGGDNGPGAGGVGGDSSLGTSNPYPRAGGGGGGNWGHTGTTGFTCPTTTVLDSCNCVQTTAPSTSNGVTPTNGKGTNTNGAAGRAGTASSAVSGNSPAGGGAASAAVFSDAVTGNNYFGTGASGTSAPFSVLRGEFEMADLMGGAGGGAGGDSIPTTGGSLPPAAAWDFDALDKKGGSGGGGGGVLIIRALGAVTIDGEINADGGDGGGGVPTDALDRVGGGGGGGAGGVIAIMSATSVTVGSLQGTAAKLHAWGGLPGAGNRPGCYQSGNSLQNIAAVTNITNAGGPGGRGLIQIHVPRQNGEVSSTPVTGNFVANSLVVDGATKTINTSSPNTLAAISQNSSSNIVISPAPFILAPDFGAVSVARSEFFYTGLANVSNTAKPDYYFSHDGGTTGAPYTSVGTTFSNDDPDLGTTVTLTASGSGATQTLASGSSSTLTVLGDNSVRITSSGLYSAVSSNPAILQADLLTIGSTSYVIASASSSSTNVMTINTEASSGAIPASGTWSVKRRYYAIDTPGSSQAIPPGSSVAVNLDVRTENGTCVPGTPKATYTSGDQEKYFRFKTTFTIGGTLLPQSPRPRLGFIKALFEY